MGRRSSEADKKVNCHQKKAPEGASPQKAVVYCRTASTHQSDGVSIEKQAQKAIGFCRVKRLEVVDVFKDSGSSGNKIGPSLEKALERCSHGDISALVVSGYDRLARSLTLTTTLRSKLRESGTRLVVAGNVEMPESPTGMMVESIMASMSEYESHLTSIQTKRGMREAKLKGKYVSRPPLGYTVQKVVTSGRMIRDAIESDIVRTVFEQAVKQNGNIRLLTTKLDESGVHNPRTGKPFSTRSLRRMLSNWVYVGLLWVDEETGFQQGEFAPLINMELFDRVQEVLAQGNGSE